MRQPSEVTKAYERSKHGREALVEVGGRCMEATEDKAGIVWERWLLPNGTSAVLFATPHWWDVYTPATTENTINATVDAIRAAAERKAA